jgi:HNH endonuclease
MDVMTVPVNIIARKAPKKPYWMKGGKPKQKRRGHCADNPGHESYPLGTIRIRRKGGTRVRFVKITHHGPKQRRWIPLARHWWLKNKGQVPSGLRVVHANGKTLDDRPENYTLMTAGEVINLYHSICPKMSAKYHQRAAAGSAKYNREIAQVRRARYIIPSLWYPVDFPKKLIINQPREERWQVYESAGFSVRRPNGSGFIATILGWPDLTGGQALVMHALNANEEPFYKVVEHVRQVSKILGRNAQHKISSIRSSISNCVIKGLIARAAHSRFLRITDVGRALQKSACPVIAVHGSKLLGPEFKTFHRDDAAREDAQAMSEDGVFDVQRCRICGCTEDDCTRCIQRTGSPCYWVEPDLCSACVGDEKEHPQLD